MDLDNIWKWLGFSQKIKAKELLEKNFILDKDYKKPLYLEVKQKIIEISNDNFATAAAVAKTKGSGGQNIQKYSKIFKNIQKYYLNVKTFKSLCLKAGTKKTDEIHEYYLKMEELIQEFICKYDCIKKLHISDKTLTKALTRNVAYNNNYFKTIGSKLEI